ncbi:two-component sensor histidine kinase [Methylosinus sp. R-45379]|uniref:ATP-binding protein n=1 Tax=unclassified Methylosinus TaxID=2624500 RepID=UPI0004B38AB5|nr:MULTISPECIES: ATP-binding protein [unclassified Methylosinus]OAI25613.1 two-component sensor histidine kinase [Methylosinus sp. R-45379]
MIQRFFATTLGQIIAIIAVSSATTFFLFLAILSTINTNLPPPPPWPWPSAYRIAFLFESVLGAPEDARAAIVARARRSDFVVQLTSAPVICDGNDKDAQNLQSALRSKFDHALSEPTVRSCGSGDPVTDLQALLPLNGRTLEVRTGNPGAQYFPWLTFPLVGALLFLCVALAALSAWAVWRVTGPLRRLADKADAFGREITLEPIQEEGPLEIRRAARAFNLMQERVMRSMSDRTRMLAAVGHDLRTPLTRMRLQLQAGKMESLRSKLLRDVDLMHSMVASTLSFLNGAFDEEEKEWLDLGALLSTLCDEFEETGARIAYEGGADIRFFCRPNAINRALTNLIENAIHFGNRVDVSASTDGTRIVLDVADDGPGVPAGRIEEILEPFVRLDPSRSARPGSVGLGLSIVKEIVEAHRGRLDLRHREPHGLIARIVFPI